MRDLGLTAADAAQAVTGPVETSASESAESILDAMNVYAAGVRSGVITPQQGDEDHFRGRAGLPPASHAVSERWQDEPTRRPVTLSQPGEAVENNTNASHFNSTGGPDAE